MDSNASLPEDQKKPKPLDLMIMRVKNKEMELSELDPRQKTQFESQVVGREANEQRDGGLGVFNLIDFGEEEKSQLNSEVISSASESLEEEKELEANSNDSGSSRSSSSPKSLPYEN